MLNSWMIVRRIFVAALLALAVAGCGAPPDQAGLPAPTSTAGGNLAAQGEMTAASDPSASPSVQASTATAQRGEQNVSTTAPSASLSLSSTATGMEQHDLRALTSEMYQQVKAGSPVKEIADPHMRLPDDVHPGQIKKYFQLGAISIGLVLRPSVNVTLNLPAHFTPSFAGLLISEGGTPWRKYLEIRDTEPTDKNNPYYLWARDGQLYLSVVDQSGAGSGEGIMKAMRLSATGEWELDGCYYFGAGYRDPQSDGDYFAFSQYLDRQKQETASACQKGEVVSLP